MAPRALSHPTGLEGGILVFLPGLQDIRHVRHTLMKHPQWAELQCISLHAMLPPQEQRLLFDPTPNGMRKVRSYVQSSLVRNGSDADWGGRVEGKGPCGIVFIRAPRARHRLPVLTHVFPATRLSARAGTLRRGLRVLSCDQVVLSTDIAESSVAVDDVVYVIDSGLMKVLFCCCCCCLT